MGLYTKRGRNMKIEEMLKALRTPVPAEMMKEKKLKGNVIDFVSWYDTCELLDARVGMGNWAWAIDNVVTTEARLVITGTVTLYGDDKTLTMSASGQEELNCSSYGDPSSNAEAMAFKRACAKFGLARYLYDKEVRNIVKQQQNNNAVGKTTTARPSKTTAKLRNIPDRWTADCGISLADWKTAKAQKA